MNKKYLFGFMAFFAVTLVSAGYLVNSFVLTTDVYEPFEVQYAIIGDAGNWDGQITCAGYDGAWEVGTDVDVGGLYAGEDRKVCTKIVNLGEGEVSYIFSAEVVTGLGNLAECTNAFGNPTVSGTVGALETAYNGFAVYVADDAAPALDCEVTLSVTRG